MKNKWYVKIWAEGKYIDFWSINHILGGALLAQIFVFLGVNFWISLVISFIIMILWEVYEYKTKVYETIQNRVMDVVVGLLGFFMIYYLVSLDFFYNGIFYIVFFIFLFLEIWGYIAYQLKKKRRDENTK